MLVGDIYVFLSTYLSYTAIIKYPKYSIKTKETENIREIIFSTGQIYHLCMESWGIPQSTVRIPIPEASIGPIVDPHPISFLTTKSCI